MTDNKRVTNKQILDKIDSLKVGDEGLNILATKIVAKMIKLKSMEDWFNHVSKCSISHLDIFVESNNDSAISTPSPSG